MNTKEPGYVYILTIVSVATRLYHYFIKFSQYEHFSEN